MAMIINDEYDSRPIYKENTMNSSQMDIDNSTYTEKDQDVYQAFAMSASQYMRSKKPFYDFKTKNRSFITLYKDYRKLGIKNNKFHLLLYDTDLQGIDPHSPLLPKDYQLKVYLECLVNPWYFLREVLRIPEDGKPIEPGGGTEYRIDRNDAATWYLYLNGIDHYKSKPRQRGKTQDCVAKFLYAYLFGNMASTMLFFNKDQDQANMNLYRLKCQRDMLPTYLQMRFLVNDEGKIDKGIENTKSVRNPVTNNTIMTMGKATSKESAMKLGRGSTAALQYFDEFDFIPYQTEIMNAASFAYMTASDNARKNHSLFGRILSSTPGDLDTRDGQAATEYVSKMLKWNDSMLDDPITKLVSTINSPSYNRFVFVEHHWKQLHLGIEWYEKQCGAVSFNEETIMREIDLQRIHGSNLSPFKRSDIMYLLSHKQEPISKLDLSSNYSPFMIYEKLKRGTPYMLCIDPSEGLAQDNNAVTLINPYSGKPAMEFKSPYISQPDLFTMLCTFMERYCPKCMIIIESNKGRELINLFLSSKYKYQLYYDDNKITKEISETVNEFGEAARRAHERRAYGLYTSSSNRKFFYAILEDLVETQKEILISDYIVTDIAGLIRKPGIGRVEAGPGQHDDNIMSYLFGMYLLRNLPAEKLEQYGIHRGAQDLGTDYVTEEGELTDKGKMEKLKELLPSLPEEMQEIIRVSMEAKSEIDDINRANREIQMYQEMYRNADPHKEINPGAEIYIPSAYEADENYWAQIDRQVEDRNNARFNHSGFDMDDFL